MPLTIAPSARGLIFDLDGTLADTMPAHFQAWTDVARKYGFDFPEQLFLDLAGVPTFEILTQMKAKYDLDMDIAAVTQEKEMRFLDYADSIGLIDPVVDLLKASWGKIPTSVGTGALRYIANRIIEKTQLGPYIDHVVSSEDVSKHKPDPETFLKCAALMGVEPQYCQVFEDGEPGLIAARTAGMIVTDVRAYV